MVKISISNYKPASSYLKLTISFIVILLFFTPNIYSEPEHTYEIISRDGSFTWFTAYDSARSLGGYLAVVTDQEEQDLIFNMLDEGQIAWLGGHDLVEEGQWRWYTGEPFDYKNWALSQPDTGDGNDYIQMYQSMGGLWISDFDPIGAFVVEYECCKKMTGNVNCSPDDQINISDLVQMVNYIFKAGDPPCCIKAGNVDGNPNELVNIADLTYLVNYIFKGGDPPVACPSKFTSPPDTVSIVDRTGKEWDVSMGVHLYGMNPEYFNFGVGPDAFPPIWFPDFLLPGDSGYPAPDSTFGVLGVIIDQESRAYRKRWLSGHEVANDIFFDSVAVMATY